MTTIEQLRLPVKAEYDQFVEEYRKRVFDQNPLLDSVGHHLDRHPGKQLRPLLVLLAAKATGDLRPEHVLLAVAVELLHNASLMHDDVVDESDTRRGEASVRGEWGNQVAVLCGDWFLAQTMQVLQEVGWPEASAIVAETVKEMCRGELLQMAVAAGGEITLGDYLEVVTGKTASLMAACCQLGGMDKAFGLHYGIVFQLRDDISSLDPAHDAAFPKDTDIQELIDEHTHLAVQALDVLAPSAAKESLRALMLPSAPGPS